MKQLLPLVFSLLTLHVAAEETIEKEILLEVNKVTVFIEGAQIMSTADIALKQGRMILKFPNLSPYIRRESIRVDGDGAYSIINVQHRNDYLNELEKNNEIRTQRNKTEEYQLKIEDEQTLIKIIEDKLDFLKANKQITGKEQSISPETFNSLLSIYGNNIEALTLELQKKKLTIRQLQKEIDKINNQLNSINSRYDLPSGTITVTIQSNQVKVSKIRITYMVDNVRWFPSYDIRFMGVNKPLTLTLKANISQNTGIDWKDVKLTLSTAKTNISANIPVLSPFYLQYYYPEISDVLQGRTPGLQITGATGTSSELRIRGISSINQVNPLYVVDGVVMNDISGINPNDVDSIQVMKDESARALYGANGTNGVVMVKTKPNKSQVPMRANYKPETSEEYQVDALQTILSDNKTSTVTFREISLNSVFEYESVPKLSENIYLIAKIIDWNQADLLNGDANLYLEESYVGKASVNTMQFKDTLDISFGIDNNISIKREKLGEFWENQLIGSNRKETLAYKLTIRNNKAYPVSAKIIDQFPVSTTRDIEVDILEISGGKADHTTGRVLWELKLEPDAMKEIILKYSVKYPKDKKVMVD